MQLTFSCSVTVWPIAFPFTFTCTGTNACRTTDSDFYKSLIKAKHCISYKMILFRMILFNTCNEDCVVNSLYLWFQKCNNDSLLLQKREIPDFVLLVTQRPSKYLGLLDTLIKRTTGECYNMDCHIKSLLEFLQIRFKHITNCVHNEVFFMVPWNLQ